MACYPAFILSLTLADVLWFGYRPSMLQPLLLLVIIYILPPLSLRLGYASQVSTARAYDLVDDNDHLPLFRLGIGYAFPLQGARLEVEGGFLSGGTSAQLFQFDRAKLGLVGVEVGAVHESPARRLAHAAAERQRAAEQIILADPFVQDMMRDFGAKIVPGSIKPA
jgi:hypothetical protein